MSTKNTKTAQLADTLRRKIADGTYAIEEFIPSTNQLITQHEVSKTVVIDAVAQLKSEGLLASQPAKGVYVIATPAEVEAETESVAKLTEEVASLREALETLSERPSASVGELAAELGALRRLVSVLHTHLIQLYNRVGQPYPYDTLPQEESTSRRASA